jgi:ABC-type spermidine/putrescine transport system permease subunit I
MSVDVAEAAKYPAKRPALRRWFWPSLALPATVWLVALFVTPFYVIVSIALGRLDQLFLTPIPVYNPLRWDPAALTDLVRRIFDSGSIYHSAFIRTFVYVGAASALCLAIGYPVAYFIARHAGRFKVLFLVAVVSQFWISYMMRMLAWINVLRPEGYVNDALRALGIVNAPVLWLNGKPITVILGLTYGYIPYMILPLFAGLDRIPRSMLEAARDLGAGQLQTFWRITLPLSRQAILAGTIIIMLPMFGDYYTQVLLASTRGTSMLGNLIVSSMQSSLVQTGASLALILMLLLLPPMIYYLRSTRANLLP